MKNSVKRDSSSVIMPLNCIVTCCLKPKQKMFHYGDSRLMLMGCFVHLHFTDPHLSFRPKTIIKETILTIWVWVECLMDFDSLCLVKLTFFSTVIHAVAVNVTHCLIWLVASILSNVWHHKPLTTITPTTSISQHPRRTQLLSCNA